MKMSESKPSAATSRVPRSTPFAFQHGHFPPDPMSSCSSDSGSSSSGSRGSLNSKWKKAPSQRSPRKRPLMDTGVRVDDHRPAAKVLKTHSVPNTVSAPTPDHGRNGNGNGNGTGSATKKWSGLDAYEKLGKLGEGTYGIVYMARDRRTEEFVALKRIRTDSGQEKRSGFPVTSIREIKILQNLDHCNIISLREVVRSKQVGFVFLVFEYFEHDLASLVDHSDYAAFSISEIKCIMKQILSAIKYAHSHFVIHRDIKLSNILLNNHGQIVLCDWGLARLFASPLQQHTSKVVTLWYRAPELLFGSKVYHTAVDMWAIGCIFAELLKHKPLLPGKNEMQQLQLIYELLGAPNHHIWPNYGRLPNVVNGTFKEIESRKHQYKWNQIDALFAKFGANCLELMKQLLAYDPSKRITAVHAELHPFFKEDPVPCTRDMMPTFPTKHHK